VSQELVAALLTGAVAPGRTTPEIVVGRLPDKLPFDIPRPDNARIVGSLARPSIGTVVFALPQSPRDASKAYTELLLRAGWDDRGNQVGGFEPPPMIYSGPFCKGDDKSISTSVAERPDGQTSLQVRYATDQRYSGCAERERRGSLGTEERGPMPLLDPPRDAKILGSSVGGSRDYTEASARIKGGLAPPQLVAHYATQLRASGWAPASDAASGDVSAQTWTVEDRHGKKWIGLFVASSMPGSDDRMLLFRVMPVELTRNRD
jgi:hypothetical protein